MLESLCPRLSDAEVAAWRHDGLVVPRFRIPGPMLGRLRRSVDRLLRDNPETPPEYLVGPHIAARNPINPTLGEEFLSYCRDPAIVELVCQLIGPDVILWSSGVFCKPPGVGRAVPWHQDARYWPIRPMATCSVWIALDAATPENGCMQYIAGSHRKRTLFRHLDSDSTDLVLNQVLDMAQFGEAERRDVVLEPGQFAMFDVYLVHGSNPNHSGKRRAGYVMRYMPATSLYDRTMEVGQSSNIGTSDFAERPIWLLRGVDRTGQNDFEVGHQEG